MFTITKEEITQLQIAIYHRISSLEKSLSAMKLGDAGYETLKNSLVQSKLVAEKIMKM